MITGVLVSRPAHHCFIDHYRNRFQAEGRESDERFTDFLKNVFPATAAEMTTRRLFAFLDAPYSAATLLAVTLSAVTLSAATLIAATLFAATFRAVTFGAGFNSLRLGLRADSSCDPECLSERSPTSIRLVRRSPLRCLRGQIRCWRRRRTERAVRPGSLCH